MSFAIKNKDSGRWYLGQVQDENHFLKPVWGEKSQRALFKNRIGPSAKIAKWRDDGYNIVLVKVP